MSRLPVLILAVAVAAGTGTLAGTAAIGGMTPLYRGAEPPPLGAEREALASARDEASAWTTAPEATAVYLAASQATAPPIACADCSDYDVGRRWAALHDRADVEACAADASAFADGCAAWLDEQRGATIG